MSLDLDDAATWLELAGCVARLPVSGLLKRLRDGDETLTDAVQAILATDYRPSQRLDTLRDFLVQQCLGDTWDPTTDPPANWRPDTSPFQVPSRYVDAWFPPDPRYGTDRVTAPIESLMRIRQFYDRIDLNAQNLRPSVRMFGNANIGNPNLTNLQVPNQLELDSNFLLTSWWITTTTWEHVDQFFARCTFRMVVGDRPEMITPGLQLHRQRQSLLVPVPSRQNFFVDFEYFDNGQSYFFPPYVAPVYVFVEGWGRRRQL